MSYRIQMICDECGAVNEWPSDTIMEIAYFCDEIARRAARAMASGWPTNVPLRTRCPECVPAAAVPTIDGHGNVKNPKPGN